MLGRLGRPAEALAILDELFKDQSEDLGDLNLRAATLARLGDIEQAISLYEQVLEQRPNQPKLLLSYGHSLKTVGRLDESIAAYRRARARYERQMDDWRRQVSACRAGYYRACDDR